MKQSLAILAAVLFVAALVTAVSSRQRSSKCSSPSTWRASAGSSTGTRRARAARTIRLFRKLMTEEANAAIAGRARRRGDRDRRPRRPRQRPQHPARPSPARGPAHPRMEQPAEHDGGHRQDVRRRRLHRLPRPGGHAERGPQAHDEPVALRRHPQRRAHARGRLERRDRRLLRRPGRLPVRRLGHRQADPGDHRADRDRRRQGRHGPGRLDDPPGEVPGDDPEGRRRGPAEPEGLQALQTGLALQARDRLQRREPGPAGPPRSRARTGPASGRWPSPRPTSWTSSRTSASPASESKKRAADSSRTGRRPCASAVCGALTWRPGREDSP